MSILEHNPDLLDVVSGHCLEVIPGDDDADRPYGEPDPADLGDLDGNPISELEQSERSAARFVAAMVRIAHATWQGFPLPEFQPPTQPGAVLRQVPLDDVMNATPELVRFAITPWLPIRHTTLLGGHGGLGKTALALAMGAHVAAGRPFAGHEVERSVVLFVSLEDEPSIVMARLRWIIEAFGLDPAKVLPRMRLLDGTRGFSALITDGDGFNAPPEFTRAFRELAEHADGAGLVIVDNASDAFDANENSRRAVRAFVHGLAAIARKHDAAVVLLAHIDKAAARNGSQGNSYSGSTAWHNSARSRLALVERDGAIVLLHEKANLSALADPLRLAFVGGVLMPCASGGSDGIEQDDFDQAEILRAMQAAHGAGLIVPAAMSGPVTALHVLETLPEYGEEFRRGKPGRQRAKAAIVALIRAGRLRSASYKTAARNIREKLELTHLATSHHDSASVEGG